VEHTNAEQREHRRGFRRNQDRGDRLAKAWQGRRIDVAHGVGDGDRPSDAIVSAIMSLSE
jgi:hypothetical protein